MLKSLKHPLILVIGFVLLGALGVVLANTAQAASYNNNEATCNARGGTFKAGTRGANICTIGTGIVDDYSMNDKILSLLYYRTIGSCLKDTSIGTQSGKSSWFETRGQNVHVSRTPYLMKVGVGLDKDSYNCDNIGALETAARDLWNIEYDDWLCAAGWLRMDIMQDASVKGNATEAAKRCRNEDGGAGLFAYYTYNNSVGEYQISDFTTDAAADELLSVIKDRVYGGKEPDFTDDMLYPFYLETFFNTCASGQNWQSGGTTSKPSTTLSNEFSIKIVPLDGGEPITKWFKYADGYNKDTPVQTRGGPAPKFDDVWRACGTMVGYLNDATYIDPYKQAVKAAIESGKPITPPGSEGCAIDDKDCNTSATTCAIDGIGWIVCPVVNFLASLSDGAFTFISGTLLETKSDLVSTDGVAYNAWSIMRNLANVAFVIAFLFIVFSQLTGLGASNYGVKKMLPRLVIAAILVNISFIICQLAVDVSNILGYSINSALNSIGGSVVDISASSNGVSPFASGEGFAGIAGAILAGAVTGVLLYALLSTLLPVLLAAVVALIMILLLLVARQALILILVVVSPLAFVAFLLPNTEKLFTQWRKMLTALLLLFPIIALVFGLSSLASTILTYTFSGDAGDSDANSFFGQLMGAAILVLPLFVVPTLLKKSLDGIPVLGQMASKFAGRANANLGNKVKDSYKGSLMGRGRAIRRAARDEYRTKRYAQRISKGGINQVLSSGVPIGREAQYANQELTRRANDAAEEALIKDVKIAGKAMTGKVDRNAARVIASGGASGEFNGKDIGTRMAAIEQVVRSNDIKGMNDLWDASRSWQGAEGSKLRSHLAQTIQSSGSKPAYFGAGSLESLRLGTHTDSKSLITDSVSAGAYSAEKVAVGDKDELSEVYRISHDKAMVDPTYAAGGHATFMGNASTAESDPQLSRTLGKNQEIVLKISRGGPPPTPLT